MENPNREEDDDGKMDPSANRDEAIKCVEMGKKVFYNDTAKALRLFKK